MELKRRRQGPARPLSVPRGPRRLAGGDAGEEPLALLGACQAGGGPIDWVMKTKGVSFRHAVELLREGDCALARARSSCRRERRRRHARSCRRRSSLDAGDQALLEQAIDYYHETLKQTPGGAGVSRAAGARRSRSSSSASGSALPNRTLGLRLPEKNAQGRRTRSARRLQKLGLLRESGHEHFNGSIVIPVDQPRR